MNPWTLIGWAIIALVGGGATYWLLRRIYRATARLIVTIHLSQRSRTTTPVVGDGWYWNGNLRIIAAILPDGSVQFRPHSPRMNAPPIDPQRWAEEVRAGRLVVRA